MRLVCELSVVYLCTVTVTGVPLQAYRALDDMLAIRWCTRLEFFESSSAPHEVVFIESSCLLSTSQTWALLLLSLVDALSFV